MLKESRDKKPERKSYISLFIFPLIAGLLILLLVMSSCKKENVKTDFQTKLNIQEPSGLCFDILTNSLWTVSDETGDIYKIDRKGNVIYTINFDGKDLEGVAISPDGKYLYIIEENKESKIIKIDLSGKVIFSKTIEIADNENDGLEGITINPNNGNVFVVNEKKPGMLIELDSTLMEIKRQELKFADDYSGLFFNTIGDSNDIWIVSDESEMIYLWDETQGVKKSYSMKGENIEGIAVDIENKIVFAVSDIKEKLFKFKIP